MFFGDILFALALAIIFTAIFAGGCRRRGPWCGLVPFFIILFFATWAGGLWLYPFGPLWFGVSWMPFLIFGLLVALLLAAATEPMPPKTAQEAVDQAKEEVAAEQTLNVFFWVILVLLIIGIISAYIWPHTVP